MDEVSLAIIDFLKSSNMGREQPTRTRKRRTPKLKASSIETLIWIDASASETINSVDNRVITINDKTGKTLTLTNPTPSKRPETNTRQINGLNVLNLKFNQFLECKQNFTTPPSGDIAILCVGDYTGPNSLYGGSLWGLGSSTSATKINLIPYNKTQFNSLVLYNAAGLPGQYWGSFPSGYPYNDPTLFTVTVNHGQFKININGNLKGVSPPDEPWTRNSMNEIYIGRNTTSPTSNTMPCGLAELIVIEAPTKTKVETLEGYLAWKWGLEGSLPESHKYKSNQPEL